MAVPAVLAHVSVRSSTLVLPLEQSCLALGLPTAVDAFTAQVSQPRAAQLSTTQQLPLKINAFIACSIDCAWLDADGIGGLHWPLGEALPPPKAPPRPSLLELRPEKLWCRWAYAGRRRRRELCGCRSCAFAAVHFRCWWCCVWFQPARTLLRVAALLMPRERAAPAKAASGRARVPPVRLR